VKELSWSISDAIKFATYNPANILKFHRKGVVWVGYDADVILLSGDFENIEAVISRGKLMKTRNWIRKGMFET
jgi:N-acetylglucosamine-6-phosphate deacetylase